MKAELLALLRSFTAQFRSEPGYVLRPSASGALRWHAEPHDLLHHPSSAPPRLLSAGQLRRVGEKPNSANDGFRAQVDLVDHFVKFPYGGDREQARQEAAHELGAYTVLGSLGLRVPHVSLVQGRSGALAVASRRIGEGGLGAWHTFDPQAPVDYDEYEHHGTHAPSPGDRAYQPLSAALVVDHDRHTGNQMVDEHGRRWDLDFGTSEAGSWLHGLDGHGVGLITSRLSEALGEADQHGHGAAARKSISAWAQPGSEAAFDWLRQADPAPFRAVGCPDPHRRVVAGWQLLQPELREVLHGHS